MRGFGGVWNKDTPLLLLETQASPFRRLRLELIDKEQSPVYYQHSNDSATQCPSSNFFSPNQRDLYTGYIYDGRHVLSSPFSCISPLGSLEATVELFNQVLANTERLMLRSIWTRPSHHDGEDEHALLEAQLSKPGLKNETFQPDLIPWSYLHVFTLSYLHILVSFKLAFSRCLQLHAPPWIK